MLLLRHVHRVDMSNIHGLCAENVVKDYLVNQGLIWVISNYNVRVGEIDLIMRDGETLVFVEVRSRRSNKFGDAIESITHQKRQKLLRTAACYVQNKHYLGPMRFDVVGITAGQLEWIKNAFGVNV